jgi:hypothetical protein
MKTLKILLVFNIGLGLNTQIDLIIVKNALDKLLGDNSLNCGDQNYHNNCGEIIAVQMFRIIASNPKSTKINIKESPKIVFAYIITLHGIWNSDSNTENKNNDCLTHKKK